MPIVAQTYCALIVPRSSLLWKLQQVLPYMVVSHRCTTSWVCEGMPVQL